MARSLVVGMGEVGTALASVIDAQTLDIKRQKIELPIDIMHITFPYSDRFAAQVRGYQKKYQPLVTVIYSTVPVGTSRRLGALHSPVEGVHPDLTEGFRRFTRFIGSDGSHYPLVDFWNGYGVEVVTVSSTAATEFIKLRSTSKYGIGLAWADYEASVAKQLGIDYEDVKDYDRAYNKFFAHQAPDGRVYQRYILDPPEGKIKGHCIIPNAKLLDEQFPSPMLKLIKDME